MGVDLSQLNYDRKSALHFTAQYGYLEATKYLVSIGLNFNGADRWGATPMTYARPFPQLYQFFKNLSAVEGPETSDFTILASVYLDATLSQDDFRAYYAAYNNDVEALTILKS